MPETLADLGEFGLIDRLNNIVRRVGVQAPRLSLGIGDDAACFRPHDGYELLITCDCVVEGRHYLPDHIDPQDLGRRAMALNISDIGAMGGRPLYALISLGLKNDTPIADVEAMYHGFLSELNPFEASIIGGNLTKSGNGLFIDITLIGEVEQGKMTQRSTAKKGDAILITGYPGQAAIGLELLLHAGVDEDLRDHPIVRAYNTPSHRAWEGRAVALSGYATAMIDTSDGFLGDLGHLCEESGVGALLIQEKLPVSDDLIRTSEQQGKDPYQAVLGESDDYELIITCDPENVDRIRNILGSLNQDPVSEVGTITDASDGIRLTLPDGTTQALVPSGWDHFAK
jgi:thiamine-monophosphate kinase